MTYRINNVHEDGLKFILFYLQKQLINVRHGQLSEWKKIIEVHLIWRNLDKPLNILNSQSANTTSWQDSLENGAKLLENYYIPQNVNWHKEE